MNLSSQSRSLLVVALLLAGMFNARLTVAAESPGFPKLYTNQGYVEESIAAPSLSISNPMAVFKFVFSNLPDHVTVYPTENYYYFSFVDRHVRYAGNMRLDVVDRDEGKVHFAYYEDLAEWREQAPVVHVVLDGARGVTVEKLQPLIYKITFDGKSVTFALNDLSGVKPPVTALGKDEVFIGPIFDESAIRFFLVFNQRLKIFHYILDETVPVADQLSRIRTTDRILIGKRTGFAFYRDHKLNRKILVGVFEGNSRVNNYFDGPFDQLPDNFIEGETLRDAILAVEPSLKGKIDRFGISPGGDDRFLVSPYRHYRTEDELLVFHQCAIDRHVPEARYHECFVFDQASSDDQPADAPVAPSPGAKKRVPGAVVAPGAAAPLTPGTGGPTGAPPRPLH